MDFYTVSYVESQITSGHTLGFVIFVVVLHKSLIFSGER